MVGFIDVFPHGLTLEFTFENRFWAVHEQYCVQPTCECTEIVLSFLQYSDATTRRIVSEREIAVVRYDYRSQSAREVASGPHGTPSGPTLLAALRAAHPSLDIQFELRHRILQTLYGRQRMVEIQSELTSILGASVPALLKVGRNDPCPCGSGKKFKKCCGR